MRDADSRGVREGEVLQVNKGGGVLVAGVGE